MESSKIAIIIGAGPAGLTAAYELLEHTSIKPIIFEIDDSIGGLSKTIDYKGNKIDIGGHRFFSKDETINGLWNKILPYKDDKKEDLVLLKRDRKSRILFLGKFFDYPISIKPATLLNLGAISIIQIMFSFIKARIFPLKESNLENFYINRFGEKLYKLFFKDYTEKVWGIPCDKLGASWGAQRVKGLSVSKIIIHAVKSIIKAGTNDSKNETSLIGKFLYPKFGPGQIWDEMARIITEKGGIINLNHKLVGVKSRGYNITECTIECLSTRKIKKYRADYFLSTMPIKELFKCFNFHVPQEIKRVAETLKYRDFITVGLLLKELKITDKGNIRISDNWLYIQEKKVRLGRVQIFNNWSPYLVKDQDKVWLGLEYFCNEGDELWQKSDEEFINFAINELCSINIIDKTAVVESKIIKVQKAYPVYTDGYEKLEKIISFTDKYSNMFLIGRNGMHRYNNMDHSMLTAIIAVENIRNGVKNKSNIWKVNTEEEYHEEKYEKAASEHSYEKGLVYGK